MRPLHLELEGFTVFRQPTSVDFTGADLFALSGPTGAGKTSLLDAITFALYGTVPRLGDRRAVAPVVSQNLTEARVRLDFAVGDTSYTAVRVVRATRSGGATTKEARLERRGPTAPADVEGGDGAGGGQPGEVVAGTADEVTGAVTELLGLSYEHFTTCVSLPQGQFARFLHDKPRERQDLLVRLLDLGIYDRVASMARQRAALARGEADRIDGQLTRLAEATPEARERAEARVAELDALSGKLAGAREELDALAARASGAREAAAALDGQVDRLDRVAAPEGVTELAQALVTLRDDRAAAARAEEEASAGLARAEAELAELPPRRDLEQLRQDLARQVELRAQLDRGRAAATDAAAGVERAAEVEAEADRARQEAVGTLERVRVEQRALALIPELHVGDPCPVCRQTVAEVPDLPVPEVEAAEGALRQAEREAKAAAKAAGEARTHQARVDEKLSRVEQDLAEVTARLDARAGEPGGEPGGDRGGTDLERVEEDLSRVGRAEAAVEEARRADRRARKARVDLDDRFERLTQQESDARRAFDAARDELANLGLSPPAAERADLAEDWAGLVRWAGERRPALAGEAAEHLSTARAAQSEHDQRWEELAQMCRAAGVDPGGTGQWPGEAVAVARARAEDAVRAVEVQMVEAQELRDRQSAFTERRQVADALAGHLAANRFEKWLLDEAVASLAEGGSALLGDLSGGAYGLSVDARTGGFTVVDHANASQPRPARTLSGGETFLASLALALALADQVADLASGGAARLETLFLDEGFGTLDPETLDAVATALDELGARGRTVGLVTHVRELAERLPVRFEVRKVGAAATVERVEA